jgi:hypothetical protein
VSRPTESPEEELARDVVSKVLGVPVERFEDGTAPGQVDALIHYPDHEAALEVAADHDPDYNGQQGALRRTKDRIEVPGLRKSWMVLLNRKAKINNVKRALPALLLAMQDNPPPLRRPWDIEPSELDRLGITKAWPLDRSTVSGRVWLVPQAWGGFAGTEDTVGEWVTEVLRREADSMVGATLSSVIGLPQAVPAQPADMARGGHPGAHLSRLAARLRGNPESVGHATVRF